MKKIIIHIGYPRTGSTYLQSKIFPNLKNINFLGKPFSEKKSKKFYLFEKKIFCYDNLYFEKKKKFLGKELKTFFKNEINLISHEGFLRNTRFYEKKNKFYKGNNYSNNIKRIYEVLKTITSKKNIYFMVFIRKQADLLPSYYSNFWESEYEISKKINYVNFLKDCFDSDKFNFGKTIMYNELYDYLTSFMPKSRVKFIRYESFFLKENREIKMFSNLFNSNDKFIKNLINKDLVNSNKKEKKYYYKNLNHFFSKIFAKKFYQTSILEKKIFNFYRKDNLKLDKKIKNLNLKLKGYY